MKSILLLCVTLFAAFSLLNAQTPKSYTINPNQTFSEILPVSEIYEYPQFENGSVLLKNGTGGTAKLNYNRFFQEIVFIDGSGDTLALASPEEVKIVVIKKDEFYFHEDRYLKLDTTIGIAKIVTSSYFTQTTEKEIGQYGKRVESSGMSHQAYILPSSSPRIGQRLNLSPVEIVTLYPKTVMMIGDENNQFHPINKKSLYNIFNKQEKALKDYLADKKPSFNSREDVVALLTYMKSAAN